MRCQSQLAVSAATFLVGGLLTASAAAQQLTTAQLQAIGQQAAAAYGVPWPLLQAQIQGESSWNPNIGCNSAGACGIAQFIPGTAAQYGVDTSNVTSSLYGAAKYDAALYSQTGSWTAALTKYTGGLTPANPGNASYATAFADAQQADAGGATPISGTPLSTSGGTAIDPGATGLGQTPVTLGDGSITAGAPGTTATPQATTTPAAPAFRPFSWLYGQYATALQQPIQSNITAVVQKAYGIYGLLAFISIACVGVSIAFALRTSADLIRRAIKLGIVGAALGADALFQNDFVAIVNAIPDWLGQGIVNGGVTGTVSAFDNVAISFLTVAAAAFKAAPYLTGEIFLVAGLVAIAAVIIGPALVLMFAVFFVATAAGQFMLILGGLLLLTLLFEATEPIWHRYVNSFLALAAISFVAIIVSTIILQLMTAMLAALPHSTGPTEMAMNLFLAGLGVFAIALILGVIWRSVETIIGHPGTARTAQNAINAVTNTISRTATAAASPAAGAVSNVVAFRRSTPVGRSLSGGS